MQQLPIYRNEHKVESKLPKRPTDIIFLNQHLMFVSAIHYKMKNICILGHAKRKQANVTQSLSVELQLNYDKR